MMGASRHRKIMNGAALWASYYRANPHRFAQDYLRLKLHLFQKVLIVVMSICNISVFIGARGIGKTFISAVYCVIRCILYPGTQICVASGVRSQGITLLEKVLLELKPNSPELALEIDEKQTRINGTNAQIVFKNSSYIKVVTASDTSRGNRCTLLLLDEFRMIPKDVIDTILRKFLTKRRMPLYRELSQDERMREYAKEKNKTLYLSSAYMTDHWSYTKCTDTFKAMLDDTKLQFVCGLPYQLSIAEGLLDPTLVEDEMCETDFNELKFQMEYESLWYGNTEGSFFGYDAVSKNRHIRYPMLPESLSSKLGHAQAIRIVPKLPGEIRILSADIALMSSKKNNNDATAIFMNQMMLTKSGRYTSNITYAASTEGMRTDEQALMIRRMYDEYMVDYIVLDTNGIGLGVYDELAHDIVDPETGDVYPALSCYNDKTMADRCTVVGAAKVIWSVKANNKFNSDAAYALREAFRSGKIRLLVNEFDGDDFLKEIKGYSSLSQYDQMRIQLPYIGTTLLIDEMINLEYEESGGYVRVSERPGRRKDRYSSLSYNYYVATQLESRLTRRNNNEIASAVDVFSYRAPKAFARKEVGGGRY